jgi:chitinase
MIHTPARWTLFSALIVADLCAVSAANAAPEEKPENKVFVGYLFGAPRDIKFQLYTHICHAFLVADADGQVRTGRSVPSRELTAKAHQAGVKVLVSLGGWGWDSQFASIVSKPEAEDRYFKSVMAIVDDNDYDGIDLDWEYPDNDQEVVGFERLTRRFRQALDALGTKKNGSSGLSARRAHSDVSRFIIMIWHIIPRGQTLPHGSRESSV